MKRARAANMKLSLVVTLKTCLMEPEQLLATQAMTDFVLPTEKTALKNRFSS
jgi:hypothetical protein